MWHSRGANSSPSYSPERYNLGKKEASSPFQGFIILSFNLSSIGPIKVSVIHVQPCDPVDSQPGDLIDSQPCDPIDSQPCDPIDSQPCDPIDSQPCDPVDSQPCDPVDPQPCDPVDPQPCDPVDSQAHGTITIYRAFFYFAHSLIRGLYLLLSAGTPAAG